MTVTIISPHRDDAIASAGLLILDLLRLRIPVQIINCFTISDYAPLRKDRFEDVTLLRRREDESAAVNLRNEVRWVDLGLIDAPLRLGCSSDVVCDLAPDAARVPDIADLAARLRASIPSGSFVIAPLAIGNHIDHIVAHRAAAPMTHAYYEDLPYAAEAEPTRLAELTHGTSPYLTPLDRLDEKLALVRLYESQFDPTEIAAIEQYAGTINGERIWRFDPAVRAPSRTNCVSANKYSNYPWNSDCFQPG